MKQDTWSPPPPSVVEAHAATLIQVHVGVAEEPFGHAFHVPRNLSGQLGRRHVQVDADLGARSHFRDVETICPAYGSAGQS